MAIAKVKIIDYFVFTGPIIWDRMFKSIQLEKEGTFG
jgi:hypothetical protein